MIKQRLKSFWDMQADAFRLSLATGAGCLVAAGALALCSTTTAALQSAQGIALVAGFYFLLALGGARWQATSPAMQPMPRSLRNRASLPPHARFPRATGGGWRHN